MIASPARAHPPTHTAQQVEMVFTSVAGHLLELEFEPRVRGWHSCSPKDLYDAAVHKGVPKVGLGRGTALGQPGRTGRPRGMCSRL